MPYVSSTYITSALEQFKLDGGRLPQRFHSNFDRKLIGGSALHWILLNSYNIIVAPSRRQSLNVIEKRTWRTTIQMAREYITEKQVGRYFLVLRVFTCRNDDNPSS